MRPKTFLLLVVLATALALSWGALDLDGNGLGDFWEQQFDAAALVPGDDTDGDGDTNQSESVLGTNPFDPGDGSGPVALALESSVTVRWDGRAHMRYQVETGDAPGTGTWTATGAPLEGASGEMTTELETVAPGRLFVRIVATGRDADRDGLSAWEEGLLGFDDAGTGGGDAGAVALLTGGGTVPPAETSTRLLLRHAQRPRSDAHVRSGLDTGRGGLIPTTSADASSAELALWFGVAPAQLPLVLPNIDRFYDPAGGAGPVGFLL